MACTPVAQAVTTRVVRALEAVLDGDMARGEVDQRRGDEERRQPPRLALVHQDRRPRRSVSSPPMPEPIITPVAQRSSSVSGSQPESSTASVAATRAILDEAVHLLLVLDRDPLGDVELALGLAGPAGSARRSSHGRSVDVEGLDGADAGFAVEQALPDMLHAQAERAGDAHAGDHHTPHRCHPCRRCRSRRRRLQAAFCFSM